jgi:hypothetical protein
LSSEYFFEPILVACATPKACHGSLVAEADG